MLWSCRHRIRNVFGSLMCAAHGLPRSGSNMADYQKGMPGPALFPRLTRARISELPGRNAVLLCSPAVFASQPHPAPRRSTHTRTGTPRFAASEARALSKVARLAWWRIATSRTQQPGNFSPLLARSSARRSGSPSSGGATVMPAARKSSRIEAPCPIRTPPTSTSANVIVCTSIRPGVPASRTWVAV